LFGNVHQAAYDVLRQADMAMYEARSAGAAVYGFFAPGMQAAVDASAAAAKTEWRRGALCNAAEV